MDDNLKRTMKEYRVGTENTSRYAPPVAMGKNNFFEQFVENNRFQNQPLLRRIFNHWIWDFSGPIFSILLWTLLMIIGFGIKTLIIYTIPLAGVGSVLFILMLLRILTGNHAKTGKVRHNH